MKAIQGIMLLTIMLAVSCTKEPGVAPVPPTAEENFVNAINEKLVWDSDGIELTANIDENKVGLLGDAYEFNSLFVEGSTTQAVYSSVYGIGFIGVELFDDNKQAVMYKKGTVELWDTKEEVSFAPEHKMESSAKGEWIAKAQPKSIRINKVVYTMHNDGNLYLESTEEGVEPVLTFTHVSQPLVVARTPDDGKHRDRAIYKQADAEFFGLLVEDGEEVTKASVYLNITDPATPAFWATEGEVLFDATSKIVIFAEVYYGQPIWDVSGSTFYAGYGASGDGAIGRTKDGEFVESYLFESVVPASETVIEMTRAIYTNTNGGFIGVEFIPFTADRVPPTEGAEKDYLEFVMYQKGTTAAWATKDAVVFDATSIVRSSSKGEWVINTKKLIVKIDTTIYEMKDDGNLYDSRGTLAFTYMHNYTPTPVTRTPNDGMDAYKAIYKREGAEEYLGLSSWATKVFTVNYQRDHDRTLFWPTPGEVVFTDPNADDAAAPYSKVPRTEEENFINNTYDKIVLDVKDKELKMDVDFATGTSMITDGTDTVYTYDSYKGTVDGLSPKYQAFYTNNTTGKYIGVEFVSPNVSMYRANGTTASDSTDWTTSVSVEFKNETTTVAGWEVVGDITTANNGDFFGSCFASITMDNDGNLYSTFRSRGGGGGIGSTVERSASVVKYDAATKTWAFLGDQEDLVNKFVNASDIVVDANANVFASFSSTAAPYVTRIVKYNTATSAWENFGDKDTDGLVTDYFNYGSKNGAIDANMIVEGDTIYALSSIEQKIVIKKRLTDGSDDWTQVGAAPFDDHTATAWTSTSIVIDPISKLPIVGIGAHPSGKNKTTRVAKFDGTDWIELGDPKEGASGEYQGTAGHNMAVNSKGEVYVAYADNTASYHHTVKKYNGTTWELVGTAGFTKNIGDYIKISFYSDDTPVVTIGGTAATATVVKAFYFDNTSWKTLGANQVSDNAKDYYTDSVIDTREGPTKDMFYTVYTASAPTFGILTVKSRPRVK